MAICAAVDGLGICLDSMLLAEQELRGGRLVVLFPETAMTVRGHGFVTLRSKADTPKVREFRTWLFTELRETKAWWDEFSWGRGPTLEGWSPDSWQQQFLGAQRRLGGSSLSSANDARRR